MNEYHTWPRRSGRTEYARRYLNDQLHLGMHVHTARADGNQYCEGGDSECPLWGIQLIEAVEAWQ